MFAKVTGNTLHATFPNALLINGIHLNAGRDRRRQRHVELVLTGNDVTGEGYAANGDADIRLRQRFNTTVELPGYAGANNDTAAVKPSSRPTTIRPAQRRADGHLREQRRRRRRRLHRRHRNAVTSVGWWVSGGEIVRGRRHHRQSPVAMKPLQ